MAKKTYEIVQTLVFYVKANNEEDALAEFEEYDNSMAKNNDIEIQECD